MQMTCSESISNRLGTWLALLLLLVCPAMADETSPPLSVFDQAFQASPDELLRAAVTGRELDNDVEILIDEVEYRFDEEGRLSERTRQVYRCLRREAFNRFGVVHAVWRPWYQARPEIRARVISPDKSIHTLDPATIEEVRVPSSDPRIFTDMVTLRAPLPSLTVGAIVETEVRVEGKTAFAKSGVCESFWLATNQPIRKIRLSIQSPPSIRVSYRLYGTDIKPCIEESAQLRTLVFETGPVEAVAQVEELLPPDVAPLPMIVFSNGRSWADAAKEYAALVDEQLKESDVRELVADLVQGEKSRVATAERILKRIHQLVRYTGVEFGRAAIVPHTPAETLDRRYGDCKDKSALMVAMLRAAGISAYVALLRSGTGFDTAEDVPGLGQFNHALVYVPGDPPLWIDPTAEFTPVGELPADDQGRWALIASPSSDQLVMTPRSASKDNRIISDLELSLSDTSPPRMVVKTEYRGVFAQSLRVIHNSLDKGKLRQWLEQVGKTEYGSETLARFESSSPEKLDEHFQVRSEYDRVGVGLVNGAKAVGVVHLGAILQHLPETLWLPPGATGSGSDKAGRTSAVVLPIPFCHEIRYRIAPPPGYIPMELPEAQTVQLGPARLSILYRTDETNCVVASLELDTGIGRFTPEDVASARAALAKLVPGGDAGEWTQPIRFEHRANRLLGEGNIPEALAEYHRLLLLSPEQAVRHAQFADALLHVGLQAEALRHARRATELEADKAYTHRELGFVLAHNRLGGHLMPGFSRNEALAAYRRVLELEPDDVVARSELATILLTGSDGLSYGDTQDVAAAITEYRRVYEQVRDETLLDSLVCALLFVGQRDVARELLQRSPPSEIRTLLLLAVVATSDGVAAAQEQASHLIPTAMERRVRLEQVVRVLNSLCEYETAKKLCEALAAGSTRPEQWRAAAQSFDKIRRVAPGDFDNDHPVSVVQKLILQALLYGDLSDEVRSCFLNPPQAWERHDLADEFPPWVTVIRQDQVASNRSRQCITDFVSAFEFQTVGDDESGYRVSASHKASPQLAGDWFVVRQEGKHQVLRAGDLDSELGKRALQHLAAGQDDLAKRWIDWAWQRQSSTPGWLDPFSGSPFARLWKWERRRDPTTLKIVAAALAAGSTSDAIPILEHWKDQELHAVQKLQVRRALVGAFIRHDEPEKALAVASALTGEYAQAAEPFAQQAYLLNRLGRQNERLKLAEARLSEFPQDELAAVELIGAATAAGDLVVAREHLQKFAERTDLTPDALSRLAWYWLFQEQVPEQASACARKAVEITQQQDPHALRILAAVSAERGDVAEAMQTLTLAALRSGEPYQPIEALIQGRVAERCGLRDIALDRYRSVERHPLGLVNSSFDLAQRRIKLLESHGKP